MSIEPEDVAVETVNTMFVVLDLVGGNAVHFIMKESALIERPIPTIDEATLLEGRRRSRMCCRRSPRERVWQSRSGGHVFQYIHCLHTYVEDIYESPIRFRLRNGYFLCGRRRCCDPKEK